MNKEIKKIIDSELKEEKPMWTDKLCNQPSKKYESFEVYEKEIVKMMLNSALFRQAKAIFEDLDKVLENYPNIFTGYNELKKKECD